MEKDLIPNPIKNFTPRQNAPKLDAANTAGKAISEADLEKLGQMSQEELITLYRLLNANKVHYSLLSKAEKREAMKLKVYNIAMESDNDAVTLKAANDWLDREDGKAVQAIKQEVAISGNVVMMGKDEVSALIAGWVEKKENKMIDHKM